MTTETVQLNRQDLNSLIWILVEKKSDLYSDLKSLNFNDPLCLNIAERSRLFLDLKKAEKLLETLNTLDRGSELIAKIKAER